MREHPILFSGPMVRAILEGRKTQTRRVVKGKILDDIEFMSGRCDGEQSLTEDLGQQWHDGKMYFFSAEYPEEGAIDVVCPYGQIGDRLWVRETWGQYIDVASGKRDDVRVCYRADDDMAFPVKWKPSIHMPRWASRITLEITNIRVERVQEISNSDIRAEGSAEYGCTSHRLNFQTLWDSINGKKHPWENNDWVWVIEFKRLED